MTDSNFPWPTQHAETLAERLSARSAHVAVVGLGYIGLPVAAALVRAGFRVLGVDNNVERVRELSRGETPLRHLGPDLVRELLASGRFEVSADAERLAEPDAVLLCVPTPLDDERRPDLSAVMRTSEALAAVARPGQLVVLESTSWPGTTRDVLGARLAASGLALGEELFVAFAPEREDPGRSEPPAREVPRVIGGLDDTSRELACLLYAQLVDRVVPVSSAEVAESSKLLENIYRAVNIAVVNEMKVLFTALDLDVNEIIDAAATKPFGFQVFRPGPGLGGHCIPVDPFYLAHRAREVGVPVPLVELAGAINRDMPSWVVQRTLAALEKHGVAVRGARVLVIGLAYKPDVDDVRESPSFVILEQLAAHGVHVSYHDPHVPEMPGVRHARPPKLSSTPLDAATLAAHDAVLVATAHSSIDWPLVGRHARLIVDTRGVFHGRDAEGASIEGA
ncbi:MAG: UDP-N-acetyl-D-glucosamine dehydrogenase [Planctomycetota bacterium]|nr:MAG: UDP-N-acetyl-D-glucosamine dehydrogenase [Planctomycetota bacterium]